MYDDNEDDNKTVELVLEEPHAGQQAIIDGFYSHRFVFARCGRRFGKSVIAQNILITECLSNENYDSIYITPSYKLGKKFFNLILRKVPKILVSKQNFTDLIIEFVNGSKIQFFSGDSIASLDNARGNSYDLIIVDEAAHIHILAEAWTEILRPTLTDRKGKAIFISTPKGKGFFAELYQRSKYDKDYVSFHYTSYDNPHIDPAEIDKQKEELPTVVFEQEFLCIETSSVGNPFRNNITKNVKPL